MIEGKNPLYNALQAKAEADYRKEVAKAIEKSPFSRKDPLKYSPGSYVYIKGMEDIFEVKKGDVGVYLLESKDGNFALCLEGGMSPIH